MASSVPAPPRSARAASCAGSGAEAGTAALVSEFTASSVARVARTLSPVTTPCTFQVRGISDGPSESRAASGSRGDRGRPEDVGRFTWRSRSTGWGKRRSAAVWPIMPAASMALWTSARTGRTLGHSPPGDGTGPRPTCRWCREPRGLFRCPGRRTGSTMKRCPRLPLLRSAFSLCWSWQVPG